ncbi:unnamed protein product, partial [Effrenium voratum]
MMNVRPRSPLCPSSRDSFGRARPKRPSVVCSGGTMPLLASGLERAAQALRAQRLARAAPAVTAGSWCPFDRTYLPSEGIAGPDMAADVELIEHAGGGAASHAVGSDLLTGVITGAVSSLVSPEMRLLELQAGGFVAAVSQCAIFGLGAYLAAGPCRGLSEAFNAAAESVPLLSGRSLLSRAFQLVVGDQ